MKPRRLKLETVRHELELLAAGANGGEVDLDGDMWPHITSAMNPRNLELFAMSVLDRWFRSDWKQSFGLFGMTDAEKWATFDTLAAAIVAERARLDRKGGAE